MQQQLDDRPLRSCRRALSLLHGIAAFVAAIFFLGGINVLLDGSWMIGTITVIVSAIVLWRLWDVVSRPARNGAA